MKPVAQLRRENLARLVDKYGSQATVAAKIGKDRNQVYQWLLEPGAKGARNIGEPSARIIEASYALPLGWLDHEHSSEAIPESQSGIPDPDILHEAETLVLHDEVQTGRRYAPRERSRQLAHAYALLVTHGGRLDAAANAAFVDGTQSRVDESGGDTDERVPAGGRRRHSS